MLFAISTALEEEAHCHGDDGPHAGSDEGEQTTYESESEDDPKALVRVVAITVGFEGFDGGFVDFAERGRVESCRACFFL